jgi:superfamily I DNA/RNA helicase
MEVIRLIGAPGTGKTTAILDMIEKDFDSGILPQEIAYISFTKKGVAEGRNRALSRYNLVDDDLKYFKTLHAVCFNLAGVKKEDIWSNKDYFYFSSGMGIKFTGEIKHYNDNDSYLGYYSLEKNNAIFFDRIKNNFSLSFFYWIKLNYDHYKKKFRRKDFTDLITDVIDKKIVLQNIKRVYIDEAQDLTLLQWQLCKTLFSKAQKLVIAGDDDQSIYAWNGASPEIFIRQKATNICLEVSYRLPVAVFNFANRLSSLISERLPKKFLPQKREGSILYINSLNDLYINNEQSYLFLVRNRQYSKSVTRFLCANGINYNEFGRDKIKKNELKKIAYFNAVIKKGCLDEDNKLMLKDDLRDLQGHKKWHLSFNWKPSKIAYYKKYLRDKKDYDIRVDTIHQAKGGEADNVILLCDISRTTKKELELFCDNEYRVLYVGVTRAKSNLVFVKRESRYGYDELVQKIIAQNKKLEGC